jgi:hypothetical protein
LDAQLYQQFRVVHLPLADNSSHSLLLGFVIKLFSPIQAQPNTRLWLRLPADADHAVHALRSGNNLTARKTFRLFFARAARRYVSTQAAQTWRWLVF